jgi:hypothetical protein
MCADKMNGLRPLTHFSAINVKAKFILSIIQRLNNGKIEQIKEKILATFNCFQNINTCYLEAGY